MSAINDALRRASSAAKSTDTTSPLPPMPVAPVPAAQVVTSSAPVVQDAPPRIMAPLPMMIPENTVSASLTLPKSKAGGYGWNLLLLIMLFIACGVGGAGAFYVWQKRAHPVAVTKKRPLAPEQEVTDNERLSALLGAESAGGKMAVTESRTNAAPVRSPAVPTSKLSPAASTSPAVRFPPLRLQSIFYRPTNPSVIINGKTLFLTDEISGVVVADIQPSSVTLVLSGQTNVLTLR